MACMKQIRLQANILNLVFATTAVGVFATIAVGVSNTNILLGSDIFWNI